MSTLPRGRSPLVLTLGLAVVGAVVAGFILFTSGKASDVDLTTASLVPADAGLYVAINTDLSSEQWVAAFNLIERLGQDDPEKELEDSADDAGVDWEEKVVPFLGGNAAIYLRSTNVSLFEQDGGLILKCKDAKAALDVILDDSGFDFDDDDYNGVEYHFAEDGGVYLAVIGDHLAVASEEDELFDIIDISKGEKSLADVEDFQRLRDELTKNFLMFVYVAPNDLLKDVLESDSGIMKQAMEEAGISDLALKPQAFVIGAKKNSFEAQNAALGSPGAIGPMTAARTSRFSGIVPGETAIFVSTQQLAQTYDKIIKDAGDKIDEAIQDNSDYRSLDEALQDVGKEIGLRSAKDIIAQLTGEAAVAVWYTGDDEDSAEGVFLAEVASESEAKTIMEKLVRTTDSAGPRPATENGKQYFTFRGEDGDDGAYAITDGYLVVGTVDGVKTILAGSDVALDEMANYREALAALPTKTGSFAYFELSTLLRLQEDGLPVDLDDAEKALKGAIINYVNERDVVRASGVLTIED